MDMNKVWISGLAITQPTLTKVGGKTPFSTFTLLINEYFQDRDGNSKVKPNLIQVESLGRSASSTAEKVKEGVRYCVDGYLRQDQQNGGTGLRVRSYAVYEDRTEASTHYKEGLQQGLLLLQKSRDLPSAEALLKELIKNSK